MNRSLVSVLAFGGGLLVGLSVAAFAGTGSHAEASGGSSVTGIGGVFFKARSPEDLREWYRRHLGVEAGPQGVHFLWRDPDDPSRIGRTVWSVFPHDTDYFGSSDQQFMLNYIVGDLDAVLSRMREAGIHPVKEPEAYPYGRFAWVLDGEGNRIELWEPPASRDR